MGLSKGMVPPGPMHFKGRANPQAPWAEVGRGPFRSIVYAYHYKMTHNHCHVLNHSNFGRCHFRMTLDGLHDSSRRPLVSGSPAGFLARCR